MKININPPLGGSFRLNNNIFMGIPHFVIKKWKYYIYCGKITPKAYFLEINGIKTEAKI